MEQEKAKGTHKSRQKEKKINGKKLEEEGLRGAQPQESHKMACELTTTRKGGQASEKVPYLHPALAEHDQSRAPRCCQQFWEAQVSGSRLNTTRRPRREPWDHGQSQHPLPPSQIGTGRLQVPVKRDVEA